MQFSVDFIDYIMIAGYSLLFSFSLIIPKNKLKVQKYETFAIMIRVLQILTLGILRLYEER